MTQWQLRVSAYAERLLNDLEDLDWTDSLKDMQRNWIGRSKGCEMMFKATNGSKEYDVTIFTTRADTVFGVTFLVLAPESDWVDKLTSERQKDEVEAYLQQVKKKTERERISECSEVMVQVPLWLFLHTTAATMPLPNILICQSFRLSRVVMSVSKVLMPRRA